MRGNRTCDQGLGGLIIRAASAQYCPRAGGKAGGKPGGGSAALAVALAARHIPPFRNVPEGVLPVRVDYEALGVTGASNEAGTGIQTPVI